MFLQRIQSLFPPWHLLDVISFSHSHLVNLSKYLYLSVSGNYSISLPLTPSLYNSLRPSIPHYLTHSPLFHTASLLNLPTFSGFLHIIVFWYYLFRYAYMLSLIQARRHDWKSYSGKYVTNHYNLYSVAYSIRNGKLYKIDTQCAKSISFVHNLPISLKIYYSIN